MWICAPNAPHDCWICYLMKNGFFYFFFFLFRFYILMTCNFAIQFFIRLFHNNMNHNNNSNDVDIIYQIWINARLTEKNIGFVGQCFSVSVPTWETYVKFHYIFVEVGHKHSHNCDQSYTKRIIIHFAVIFHDITFRANNF